MTQRSRQLTIDEAMGQFQTVLKEELGDAAPNAAKTPESPETPEEAEANRFRFAEYIVGLACPGPTACTDQRCRRNAVCRHIAHLRATQRDGVTRHPRRTPGAEAIRYAVWLYMNTDGV